MLRLVRSDFSTLNGLIRSLMLLVAIFMFADGIEMNVLMAVLPASSSSFAHHWMGYEEGESHESRSISSRFATAGIRIEGEKKKELCRRARGRAGKRADGRRLPALAVRYCSRTAAVGSFMPVVGFSTQLRFGVLRTATPVDRLVDICPAMGWRSVGSPS